MTPQQAEEIFYETYRAGNWHDVGKPLIQKDLREQCWKAVIVAAQKEAVEQMALEYLQSSCGDERKKV